MAVSTETPKTAWGSTHVYLGEVSTTDYFPLFKDLEDEGTIIADGLTLDVTDGDNTELKDINGVLIDKLVKEPTYTLTFRLLKPTQEKMTKFWQTILIDNTTAGTSEHSDWVGVRSNVVTKQYAMLMANIESVGSDILMAGKCSLSAKLQWSATEGYSVECSVEFLKGYKNLIYNFGLLTEADQTTLRKVSGIEE